MMGEEAKNEDQPQREEEVRPETEKGLWSTPLSPQLFEQILRVCEHKRQLRLARLEEPRQT